MLYEDRTFPVFQDLDTKMIKVPHKKYVHRFKKTWKLQALREGKTNMHPPYSLGQLVSERPKPTPVLVPLISPPVSPSSLGSDNISRHSRPDARGPQSPYDISNRDYFFPR